MRVNVVNSNRSVRPPSASSSGRIHEFFQRIEVPAFHEMIDRRLSLLSAVAIDDPARLAHRCISRAAASASEQIDSGSPIGQRQRKLPIRQRLRRSRGSTQIVRNEL